MIQKYDDPNIPEDVINMDKWGAKLEINMSYIA